ncbi:hypothetical protein [Spirillospora sp. CA-294931]|uniref:hypothetical protein n=1 Tax=Spirillospora sp. CA-294931 TaxID=3240042 RepID=UPI003D906485
MRTSAETRGGSRPGRRLPLRLIALILAAAGAAWILPGAAWADGTHGTHDSATGSGPLGAAIRLAVLLAVGTVAGAGVVRPLTGPPARRTATAVSIAGAVAATGALAVVDRPLLAIALGTLTLGVALSLGRTPPAFAGGVALCAAYAVMASDGRVTQAAIAVGAAVWLGASLPLLTTGSLPEGRRLAPWLAISGAASIVAGIVQADLPKTVAVAGLAITAPALLYRGGPRKAATVGMAGVVTAGIALTAVPGSEVLRPGVPVLHSVALGGDPVPVLLAPQRPGWNVVHTGDRQVSVGTDADRLTATARSPGATGTWGMVWLPPGPGRLWIRGGGRTASVRIDAGRGVATSPQIRTDGPECASAALGGLAAGGSPAPLRSCPAQALGTADAGALRAALGFIAGRGVRSVFLAGDGSPRSRAAATVIRDAAAGAGLTVAAEPGARRPIVVVSGWSAAESTLRDIAGGRVRGEGAYLAPWLLSAPLLAIPAGQVLPLRFSPRDPVPLKYAALLQERFHGAVPTKVGFDRWQEAQGRADTGPAKLYAASLVTFMPTRPGETHPHTGTSWLPGGTITVASGPLR